MTARRASSDRHRRSVTERHTRRGQTDRVSRGSRRKTIFKGIPVVSGVAMGEVRLKFRKVQILADRVIAEEEVEHEIERLDEAVRLSKEQLLTARMKVAAEVGELEAMIFDAHLAILEDRAFLKQVKTQVASEHKPVEVVVASIVDGYYQTMSVVSDEHMRERAADIRDIGQRLLGNLDSLRHHRNPDYDQALEQDLADGDIVFARELFPSDIASLERRHCRAIISDLGNDRGHVAVLLRAMGVPCVMGLETLANSVQDGDFVIVDGGQGVVYLNPRKDIVDEYAKTLVEFEQFRTRLRAEAMEESCTKDGISIGLYANVSKPGDVDLAKRFNVAGVGLFRSEFMLMGMSEFPGEDEQYRMYRDVIQRMDGSPVTIRTMDIGADKQVPWVKQSAEEMHVLGRRSLRLAMELEDFQLIQLRAIMRAAVHGRVKLMFPFVTALEDIRWAKRMVRHAKRDLEQRRVKFQSDLSIGMMVEVPAVALSLEKFAREVSYFSVGTNDLAQFVCAADRNHPDVAPWYKGYNPGMLRLIKMVADTANEYSKELTLCGEMAGDPFYTLFLLGVGVRQLSMSAPQVPLVKKIIRSVDLEGCQRLADRALRLASTGQIRDLLATSVEQILGRDLTKWASSS